MAGYTRQSTFADGDTITSALFNNEYNQLLNAFGNTSGHKHDGTANEGPVIGLIGDAGIVTPLNKVLIDSTNDHIEFWIEVSSSSVQQLYIADGAIVPVTDNDIDLGTSSLQFKDLYINGTANIDSLVLATGSTVTAVLDEDDLSSNSATSLVTQQSVKAYIDAQVTAQDLDFLGDSGGALSIDLDSESLTIAGGTGLATVGSGNTITVNIDSTVATLTGSQTLTNKTIDVDNNTVSNIEVDNFKASAIVLESEGIGSNDNDTSLPTSAAVKDYVDTQITAEDLDITTDSGTIAIDLDSETLTVSGGTGLDSSATGNAVTLAIDSTVTTLTGTQTLTNKTLTSATLTSPVINTGVSGTAFLDDDTFATATASTLASSESIKAYVDTTVAATNEVVEDTTPQLGGDLASNGNDILFADNDKAIFGTGSDLQIYHDASDGASFIKESGSGHLRIQGSELLLEATNGDNFFRGIENGSVRIYHDNSTVLQTTSTGIDVTGVITTDGLTTSADINFGDNDKAIFGAGSDLQIYHDGNNSYISDTGTGNLNILANEFAVYEGNGTDLMIGATPNGAVTLSHNAQTKLATTSTGIDVTGTATMDAISLPNLEVASDSGNTVIDSTSSYLVLEGSNIIMRSRDGTEDYAKFFGNGAVQLYSDNSLKLATTSTGIDVTGTVTADGLTVDGGGTNIGIVTKSTDQFAFIGFEDNTSSTSSVYIGADGNDFIARANSITRFRAASNGDISFYEDTGSTAGLFWDASAESLGIGRTSLSARLHVQGPADTSTISTSSTPAAKINNGGAISLWIGSNGYNYGYMQSIQDDGTNNLKPLSLQPLGGNVGIGTTSPSTKLHVNSGSTNTVATFESTDSTVVIPFIDSVGSTQIRSIDGEFAIRTGGDASSSGGTLEHFRIDGSGNVGIGTDNPSRKLTVSESSQYAMNTLNPTSTAGNKSGIAFHGLNSASLTQFYAGISANFDNTAGGAQSGSLIFETINSNSISEKMRIDSTGNVGIGITNIATPLHVSSGIARTNTSKNYTQFISSDDGDDFLFGMAVAHKGGATGSDRYISIDSSSYQKSTDTFTTSGSLVLQQLGGNVGIGETSPEANLHIKNASAGTFTASNSQLLLENNTTVRLTMVSPAANACSIEFGDIDDQNVGVITYDHSGNYMNFKTNTADAMRIDSSGNVLVGTTDDSLYNNGAGGNTGTLIESDGTIQLAKSNNITAYFNRLDGDGDIVSFRKDGSTVGSIGSHTSTTTNMYIGSVDSGLYFDSTNNRISPYYVNSNALPNGGISLGGSSNRFQDLHLSGTANVASLTAQGGIGNAYLQVGSDTGSWTFKNYRSSHALTLEDSDGTGEVLRVDTSGNLLVGGTPQLGKLTLHHGSSDGLYVNGTGTGYIYRTSNSTGLAGYFVTSAGAAGSISCSGTSTTYNTSSDARLKDVTGEARGLEVINKLNPVSYNWKADGKADEGLIAQEVQEIVPNAVTGSEEEMYQMDYSKLVVHLVAGMKEQQTQIEALQSEINKLKGE